MLKHTGEGIDNRQDRQAGSQMIKWCTDTAHKYPFIQNQVEFGWNGSVSDRIGRYRTESEGFGNNRKVSGRIRKDRQEKERIRKIGKNRKKSERIGKN